MELRVHHCPRCGAPLQVPDGTWAVRCNYCQVDVSLLGQAKQRAPVTPPPVTPAAPSLGGQSIFPIMMGLFGLLAPPTFFFLDRNDDTSRPVIMAIVGSIAGFVLYGTGRLYLGSGFSLALGLVLLLKPFVRPVMSTYSGGPMSLNSETHYYFLIPGFLMSAVFGWLLLIAIEARKTSSKSTDGRSLRIVAGIAFCAGMFISNTILGGPTTADVLSQYRGQGMAMRGTWQKVAMSLPARDAFQAREKTLVPTPVWNENMRKDNNIEIVHAHQLRDPEAEITYGNLYLNGDLTYALGWTGPKNKLSSSKMGEPGGSFEAQLARAFATPWLAVYRDGNQGIEIFVFDMRTAELVVATSTNEASTSNFTGAREAIMKALAKATGGTFRAR